MFPESIVFIFSVLPIFFPQKSESEDEIKIKFNLNHYSNEFK